MDFVSKVSEFYETFTPELRGELPQLLSADRSSERYAFLFEEVDEYHLARLRGDIVEQVDGLVDIIYIALGTLIEMGIPIRSVFEEIHASNMRKLDADGKPIIEGGKIRKPEGWVGPDVESAMNATSFAEWALSTQAVIDELNDLTEDQGRIYDEGYEEGYQHGREEGYDAAEADFQASREP